MSTDSRRKLENLLDAVTDPSKLTDEEVRDELKRFGLNLSATQSKFEADLDAMLADRAVRQRLGRRRAPTQAVLARMMESVRGLRLGLDELASRITQLQPLVAHRELRTVTREDLESQYAELLAIQATERGEVE